MKENNTAFHKENIIELMEGLTPFPHNIFVAEQQWLNDYVLPLISIDLGILRKDLQGTKVHMINPIEPFDGLLGEKTEKFHNEFCGENWIAFELTQDNTYRFLADKKYFLLADKDNICHDFKSHIEETLTSYQEYKNNYNNTGKQNFLDNLGGKAWYGNWVCYKTKCSYIHLHSYKAQ